MWEQTERIFLDAIGQALHAIARVLPAAIAVLLIVILAVALALVLRSLVRRVCDRAQLDRRLREWGVAAPAREGKAPPSRQVARVVSWSVVAIGALAGLSAIDAAGASALAMRVLGYVPSLLVAVVILAAGVAGSRIIERSLLIGAVNMGFQSARMIGFSARWLVLILAVAVALEHLGIGGHVVPIAFGILFGGIVLALALACGLGARETVQRALARRFPAGPQRVDEPPDEHRVQHL